ncbi:hypothetical protein Trco_007993 [Trichoderma cornu-damae]|uniref:Uncharacterized protein n=1 Tax=Trichoderma cornu-damae TaxID=654480 RepID=A0A9P8TSL9_9HYPO|nr:hypothetical protein Trco_007993 [Trichoderma cornu-damae]
MPRLPPAFEVFPTLARFKSMRPRRLFEVPIGGPASNVTAKALQQSAIHLYHDLGVVVFAGCSVGEVRRIGDVLREVVAWGGQGGVVARLDAWEGEVVRRREEDVKGEGDLYKALDEKRTGIIKPEVLLQIATKRFQETLKERIPELETAEDIDIRQTQVILPGSPPPRGIINKTVDGPRRLPIESFTTMGVNRVSGYTIGETRFFTVGSSNYVGGARVDYLMLKYGEDKDKDKDKDKRPSMNMSVRPFWGYGKLKQRRRASDEAQGAIFDDVVTKVMQPLWDLERSVWAAKAEELERRREMKKKWGGGDDAQPNAI